MRFARPRILWFGTTCSAVSNRCSDDVVRSQEFELDGARTVHHGIAHQFAGYQLGRGYDLFLAVHKLESDETPG